MGSDENAGHDLGGPRVIATLEGHGIPASDIKKLQEAGIYTVEALAHAPLKTLNAIKGLSEVKVTKLKQAGALRLVRPTGVPGPEVLTGLVVPSREHCAPGLRVRHLRAAAARAPDTHHHWVPRPGRPAGRCVPSPPAPASVVS